MSGTLPVTHPTVADHYFYPPVGRLERQWDLYVEGTGYGTWPSELDPVWHPRPYYYRWTTGRVLNGLSLVYVTAGRGELTSVAVVVRFVERDQLLVITVYEIK